jgi:predicted NBD/HSP70 family sugar kinase
MARAVNSSIASEAVRMDATTATEPAWAFFCECGRQGCLERVVLSVSEYAARRQRADPAVIADGHEIALRAREARRLASTGRAEAAALRAQAEQIRRRYGANREPRHPLPPPDSPDR